MRTSSLLVTTLLISLLAACEGSIMDSEVPGFTDGGLEDSSPYDFKWWVPTGDAADCSGCLHDKVGNGGKAFSPGSNESEFVAQDSNGALVIDMQSSKLNNNLWVADTNLPGAVKIDLTTMKISGRYRTGGSNTSRTTVNSLGEAFVGARTDGSGTKTGVTKILPQGSKCVDTNKDGTVTSSTGASDVKSYGKDDCVAWHVNTPGDIRGLAAQDIPGMNHAAACKGFNGEHKEFDPKKVLALDQHYIWIGGVHGKVYKLDAVTGKLLMTLTAPVKVYGAALSGDGKLWLGAAGTSFGFIDTLKCTDQSKCEAAATCTATCGKNTCPSACDNAIKAVYTGAPGGYGITVDYKKRVWRSGYPAGPAFRYDPNGPVASRIAYSTVLTYGGGIGADGAGWVWASHLTSNHVARIHADKMTGTTISVPSKGIAVDIKGRIFSVEYAGKVHMIVPGATSSATDYKLTKNAVVLNGVAYAYSDMTGVQTRLASGEPGWYRQVFSPCPAKSTTEFRFLSWDVEAPAGTWVMFNMRSAKSAAALKLSPWYTVACINPPGGKGRVKVSTFKGSHAEVEVRFIANGDLNKPASVKSAKINSFGLLYRCLAVQ